MVGYLTAVIDGREDEAWEIASTVNDWPMLFLVTAGLLLGILEAQPMDPAHYLQRVALMAEGS